MGVLRVHSKSSGSTANKGSSSHLENYKEHEARERQEQGRNGEDDAKCRIFDAENDVISVEESTKKFDNNRKGLKASEAKFYEIEVNPSQGEQQAMFKGCKTDAEREAVFRDYVRNQFMEDYAQNFKGYKDKQGNPVEFHKEDIVWSGVIHTDRQQAKDKEGLNWHAHITVSHRNKGMTRSLSPDRAHQASNKGRAQGYFNLQEWKRQSERSFDKRFGYDRPKEDSYDYMRTQRTERQKAAHDKQVNETIQKIMANVNQRELVNRGREKAEREQTAKQEKETQIYKNEKLGLWYARQIDNQGNVENNRLLDAKRQEELNKHPELAKEAKYQQQVNQDYQRDLQDARDRAQEEDRDNGLKY